MLSSQRLKLCFALMTLATQRSQRPERRHERRAPRHKRRGERYKRSATTTATLVLKDELYAL